MSLTMANGFDESIKTDLSQWNKIPHNKEQQPSKNQFVNKFIFYILVWTWISKAN